MKIIFHFTLLSFLMFATGAVDAKAPADDSTPTAFDQILESYEAVRLALTNDTTEGVSKHGDEIETILKRLSTDWSPSAAGIQADMAEDIQELLPQLSQAAAALASATSLDATRDAFYELSRPLVLWRKAANPSTSAGGWPIVAYCPMAKRSWLQPRGDVSNPYYGQSMLRCGEIVEGRS